MGEAVCHGDISHSHSRVPRHPEVPQSSTFCRRDPPLSTAWPWVRSADRMPQSIVPNTQFGLKLPRSCFETYRREASPSHLFTLRLFSQYPEVWGGGVGGGVAYQLSISSEGDVFICKDKNVYPVRQFCFSFALFLWKE